MKAGVESNGLNLLPPVDPQPFFDEMESLDTKLRTKYADGLAAFGEYLTKEKEHSDLEFPFDMSAEDFRAYLAFLEASYERKDWQAHRNEICGTNDRQRKLLDMVVMLKLTAEGIDAKSKGEITLGGLEKNILESIDIAEDYMLLKKFARDAGPVYGRTVSRLLHLVGNVNFVMNTELPLDELDRRSAAMAKAEAQANKTKDWDMMRLGSEVCEANQKATLVDRLGRIVMFQLNRINKGTSPEEAFLQSKNSIIRQVVMDVLVKYHASGKITEDIIDDIGFILGIAMGLATKKADDDFKTQENLKFTHKEGRDLMTSITSLLIEIIGVEFAETAGRPFVFSEKPAIREGLEPLEFFNDLGEAANVASFRTGKYNLSDETDRKFLVENKDTIMKGYLLNKALLHWAKKDIEAIAISRNKNEYTDFSEKAFLKTAALLNMETERARTATELLEIFAPLQYMGKSAELRAVYTLCENKFWAIPGALGEALRQIGDLSFKPQIKHMNLPRLAEILGPEVLAKRKNVLDDLNRELLNCDYQTFVNACLLAANAIEKEKGWGAVSEKIARNLFSERKHCFEPGRVAALKTIMDGMSVAASEIFFGKAFAHAPFFVGVNAKERDQLVRMLDIKAGGVELSVSEEIDLGELKVDGEIGAKDLKGLIDYIQKNRSIILSGDGKELVVRESDSALAGNFSRITFSLNKDGRKNRNSLACNVNLKLKNGRSIYLSMSAENELKWRVFIDNKFVKETSIAELMASLDGKESENGFDYTVLIEEIYYLVLKKLEEVFVRKMIVKKEDVQLIESGEEARKKEIPQETDEEEKPDSIAPISDELPIADVRRESPAVINLADDFTAATKMNYQDLDEKDDSGGKVSRKKIGENKALALRIFGNAVIDNKLEIDSLGEKLPGDLADLIVYQKVQIGSEEIYEEISPTAAYLELRGGTKSTDEIYIRTGSAHSHALPYIKGQLPESLSDGEKLKVDRITGKGDADDKRRITEVVVPSKVRQAEMELRMQSFELSRESREINLEPREKVLYIDVDEKPEIAALFERMKSESAELISIDITARIKKVLAEKIKEAKSRLIAVDVFGLEYEECVNKFNLEKVRLEEESIDEIQNEIQRAMKIQTMLKKVVHKNGDESVSKLRLPQAMKFNQTFNQGRFQSLSDFLDISEERLMRDDKEVAA